MSLVVRFHSGLELVSWDALGAAEQEQLRTLAGMEEPPAIVRPLPGCSATIKVVDRATAILLQSFRSAVVFSGSATLPEHLRRLILDGLLECRAAGDFVSGPRAARLFGSDPALAGNSAHGESAGGRTLSMDALRYAASLPYSDPAAVASRLYACHTAPCTAKWKRALAADEAVAHWLGLGTSGKFAGKFAEHGFQEIHHSQWLAWHRTAARPEDPLRFKLYISPMPEALPETLPWVIQEAIDSAAGSFKVGRTLANVLRPDKMILYYSALDALTASAARLEKRLRNLPAHGVPFTCTLDRHARLSWGSDPPHLGELAGWAQGESWRAWVVRRLAGALVEARREEEPEPWRFALAKIQADGVDPVRWVPVDTFWM